LGEVKYPDKDGVRKRVKEVLDRMDSGAMTAAPGRPMFNAATSAFGPVFAVSSMGGW